MAIGNIPAGTSGTFAAALLDNGVEVAFPANAVVAWSADDSTVVLTPTPNTTACDVAVPAGDLGTSVTITASTTAPDGSTVTGQITVPLTPTPQQFTLQVTQIA